MVNKSSALVLFSGGQDSATCLAWALARYDYVETVGFTYGQRHNIEMACRKSVLSKIVDVLPKTGHSLGVDHIIDLQGLGDISETALTRDSAIKFSETGLPNTFVPGRNLIFLNFAAALGYRRGITNLIGGMCEEDYSGYPDCRRDTMDATMKSISLGMNMEFNLETPLMSVSKAQAWKLAEELGGAALTQLILEETHSCYLGERKTRHAWGYGCGTCPACELRANGWEVYQAA